MFTDAELDEILRDSGHADHARQIALLEEIRDLLRPMTGAERGRRHRAMKALRLQRERDEALTQAVIGSLDDREIDIEVADFVLAGLLGGNEQAVWIVAAFLTGLPRDLEALRAEVAALHERLGALGKSPAPAAGARKGARGAAGPRFGRQALAVRPLRLDQKTKGRAGIPRPLEQNYRSGPLCF